MKKQLFLFVCAFAFTIAQAQVNFGVKAGANVASIVGPDIEGNKMIIGFHGGVLSSSR